MTKEGIAFIGLGNMAKAIISGLRGSHSFSETPIAGYDRNRDKQVHFENAYQVHVAENACDAASGCSVLVLAVKPHQMAALLAEIAPCLKQQLVISLAAGKPLAFYEGILCSEVALVRAMPNINARVAASMTGLCANRQVSENQLDKAVRLFDAIGSVAVLPEEQLAAFSAIAGAGPAFAYAFIDALASAGLQAGLPRELAQRAACAMLFGSAKMVAETGEHPRALMDQVTSPGGTTIEGLHQLAAHGFEHGVHAAVRAVIAKNAAMIE